MKTGKVVTGSVLDCNKKYLERALKDYDPQLYLKWNPEKNAGMGLWELRRRPDMKTAVPKYELGGAVVFELEYLENPLVHHVLDLAFLNYELLTKLREMDTWQVQDWSKELEYKEDKQREVEYEASKRELRYAIKHYRTAFKDFKEAVRSGRSPGDFLRGTW